jgi:hypothetical protein
METAAIIVGTGLAVLLVVGGLYILWKIFG